MRKILTVCFMCLFSVMMMGQDYSNLYVVGAAFECKWDAGKAYPMEKEDNGVFTWTGPMTRGDFKFLLKTTPSDVWINCLNAKVANEKIVVGKTHEIMYVENSRVTDNDYKFMMDSEGVFKVTVDTENLTLTITKSDLISVSRIDGRGKRIVNIHSCSGKTNNDESAYKLLLGEAENLKDLKNKWAYKGDDPWVIFSLSGIYSINRFDFRDGRIKEMGAAVRNLPEYKVYVSTTGTNDNDWTEVIHETGVGEMNVKSKKIAPVEAKYIKFVPVKDPADDYVRIYGVDIYGSFVRPIDAEIISTGKTVVDYHSSWGYRETPANILDGISSVSEGVDTNNPWAFGKSENNGWVIIDLEDSYEIQKFVLTESEEWITGYNVYISNFVGKDSDWKLIFSGTFDKELVKKEGQSQTDKPATGKYLKLEIPANHQHGLTRIREFEVFGKQVAKPGIVINSEELKAAYDLAIWTVDLNTTQDGVLKAGARYDGKWTRDLSINVWNGYSFLDPDIARNSLLSLLMNNTEQLIGAEYWDKIIWVKGAYTYYLTTGDEEFLAQAFKSGMNTMKELENMKRDNYPVFDAQYGLFTGPSVFNDGIAGYEEPVFAGDNLGGAVVNHPAYKQIKCLSTNCIYYEAYRLLAKMAASLGEEDKIPELEQKAVNLKNSIRTHLFDETTGKLSYLIDQNGDVHPHQEGLGLSFAIMFDIVTPEEAQKIVTETFVTKYGLPSISPHFKRFSDERPGRHNMMIWPFVNGFWANACIKARCYDNYKAELYNLANLGINKGQDNFWEIYDPQSGLPDGGWQGYHWGGLEHQTWSATGFLNMVWHGLAGIRLEEDKIAFEPYLMEELDNLELTNLKYGNMILNIKIEGKGSKVKEFRLNGQVTNDHSISRDLTGEQNVYILVDGDEVGINQPEPESNCFSIIAQSGSVVVKPGNGCSIDSTELFDITGKVVASRGKAIDTFSVGNDLVQGVYVVRLKCNGSNYTERVFITK